MESKSTIFAAVTPEDAGHDAHTQSGLTKRNSDLRPYDRDLDQAYWYLQEKANFQALSPVPASALKKLRRKIDWRIVPIMFCCYTMQFIDKVLLNVGVHTVKT